MLQVATLAALKALKPSNKTKASVDDIGGGVFSEYIFLEDREDLIADDENIIASTVPGRQNDRWVRQTAQGGGGGGSAYPDNANVFTTSTQLTSAHQGLITAVGAGIVLTLPATPTLGETYKFVYGSGDYNINTNGIATTIFPAGNIEVSEGVQITLVGNGSTWSVITPNAVGPWDADVRYVMGQGVSYGGSIYLSLTTNNIGNQPDIEEGHWVKADDRIELAALSVSGTLTDYDIGTQSDVFARVGGGDVVFDTIAANGTTRKILMLAIGGKITLKYLGTGGAAANRIFNDFDIDFIIPQGGWCEIVYDVTSAFWRVIGASTLVLNRSESEFLTGHITVTGGVAPSTPSVRRLRYRANGRLQTLSGQIQWDVAGSLNTKVEIDVSGWSEVTARMLNLAPGSAVINVAGPQSATCYYSASTQTIVIEFTAASLQDVWFEICQGI